MWNFSRLCKNLLFLVLEGRGARISLGLPFMYPFMPFLAIRIIYIVFSIFLYSVSGAYDVLCVREFFVVVLYCTLCSIYLCWNGPPVYCVHCRLKLRYLSVQVSLLLYFAYVTFVANVYIWWWMLWMLHLYLYSGEFLLYNVPPLKTPFGLLIPLLQSQSQVTTLIHNYFLRCYAFTQLWSLHVRDYNHLFHSRTFTLFTCTTL
jgi:hypothetical protein